MKTDSQLKRDVIAELEWEPAINGMQIGVEVKDGIVTLTGHVDSFGEKWTAERATQRVSGVRALAIEIDVELLGSNNRNDADIARSVENVLQWTTCLSKDTVEVMVENGWVTLSGEVSWDYQREAATSAVRHLMGVCGVSNQIAIKSQSAIKSDIEAALKRGALSDAKNISIDIRDGDVTLTGTVHSWSERELATHAAWAAAGVQNVVDNLVVAY